MIKRIVITIIIVAITFCVCFSVSEDIKKKNVLHERVQYEIESTIGAKTEYPECTMEYDIPTYAEEGYLFKYDEWKATIQEAKDTIVGKNAKYIEELEDFLSEEEIRELNNLEYEAKELDSAINAIECKDKYCAIIDCAKEKKEAWEEEQRRKEAEARKHRQSNISGNNFKRDGIWRDDQFEYSWYSSNTLRHYRTDEWTPDSNGIYRDDNGYVCAASDDYPLGTVVSTEKFGDVIITDTGVGTSGRLDIYTNF